MGAQRMSLLAVSEAQKRLFALAGTVHAEEVPLAEAFGRWLGRDVKALRDQPWASLSAMDGYAIRHADLPGHWSVTGERAAGGEGAPKVNEREAVGNFTGAVMPKGADSIGRAHVGIPVTNEQHVCSTLLEKNK